MMKGRNYMNNIDIVIIDLIAKVYTKDETRLYMNNKKVC